MKKITFGLLAMIVSLLLPQRLLAEDVTETYDFETWGKTNGNVAKGAHEMPMGEDALFTVNNVNLYQLNNYVSESTGATLVLNNRFAANTDIRYRYGSGKTDVPNIGCTSATSKVYISLTNLKKGDRFKITGSGVFYSSNATDAEGTAVVAETTTLVSDAEYTMAADGHVDFFLTNWAAFKKVVVTRTLTGEEVSAPTFELSGTSGINRFITVTPGKSTLSNTVKTYYTLNGDEPTGSANEYTTDPIKVSESCTIKAISISSAGTKSLVASFKVDAGTVIKLATPVIALSGIKESDGMYYPVVTVSSDNSSTIGQPVVTYKALLDGKEVALDNASYTFTLVGTLTVTSSAEGYDDSESVQYTASSYAVSTLYDFSNPEFTSVYTTGVEEGFAEGKQYSSAKAFKSDFEGKTYVVKATGGIFDFMELQTDHSLLESVGILNVGTGNRWVKLINLTNKVIAKFEFVTTKSGSETIVEIDGNSQTTIPRYNALKAITIYSPAQTVTVNEYSTFSSTSDVDFSAAEGLKVYTAKLSDAKDVVTLTEVADKKVPAGQGVLLKGTGEFVGFTTTGVAAFESNDLIANTEATAVTREDNIYVLNNVDGIGFYPFVGTLTVGKAHLVIEGGNAKSIKIAFGGDTTGISNVESTANGDAKVWHTLSGVRVQNPTKGLYIVNGKKVVVK